MRCRTQVCVGRRPSTGRRADQYKCTAVLNIQRQCGLEELEVTRTNDEARARLAVVPAEPPGPEICQ
eukprot:963234-Pyramimonas_sp.AAC.1